MFAEIIAIGTELTSGAKLDTNSQWLSLQLADLGISVVYHSTVADDLQMNIDVLQTAIDRVDFIVLTGGLGPTKDDLTRFVLAQLTAETGEEAELILDQESLDHLGAFFATRGREMPESNRVQAMFPKGATPLLNPIGTAPGIWMSVLRTGRTPCLIACLPGVPSEMKKMFKEQVKPRLPGGQVVIRRARINCFGLGESATEELLGELTARGNDPEIGITAHDATITLRIIAHGANVAECDAKIRQATQEINLKLGDYVFGTEDEELQDVVLKRLAQDGKTLATVESGTNGLLTHWLSQVPNGQKVYLQGLCSPVLKQRTEEMAIQAQLATDADYVLVIGDETVQTEATGKLHSLIPVVLLKSDSQRENNLQQVEVVWNGNPHITHSRAVKTALNLLWKALQARS